MAIKKIEIRPKGTNNYEDVLYPKTSADQVEMADGTTVENKINNIKAPVESVNSKIGNVELKATDIKTTNGQTIEVQLGKLAPKTDLDKKINKYGDSFIGVTKAYSNTSYSLSQIRNIVLSDKEADLSLMSDGEIWIQYKEV